MKVSCGGSEWLWRKKYEKKDAYQRTDDVSARGGLVGRR